MRKLNLNFSYSFNGKIWNIISHPDSDRLLLEVRRHDKFITTYSLLDAGTGQFLFRDIEFEEKWWIGASHFADNLIVFHVYPDQENPDVKNVFAYHVLTEKILWEKTNKNIIGFTTQFLMAMAPEDPEKTLEYYELQTGEEAESEIRGKDQEVKKNKMLEATFHYRQGTTYFDTTRQFLKEVTGKDVVKGTDYYENDRIVILSYYYKLRNDKLANDLLVVDHNGEHLLNVNLGTDLSGISSDTFFVFYNKLIFVKDNSNLLMYQLP